MKTIIISTEQVGQRLDKVLVEALSYSRTKIQSMVKEGLILINETKKAPHYFLKEGDVITIPDKQVATKKTKLKLPAFSIIEQTDEYIVVHKPTGVIVHPATIHPEHDTLIDAVIDQFPEVEKVGDDPMRPGVVHRLDKDASGVMVIARTQDSFENLKRQFKMRTVNKEYLILTYGEVIPKEGTIRLPIERSVRNHTRFAAKGEVGKEAITEYWVITSTEKYSLIRVHPLTGRTHQIRVHFFSKGNGLVGDVIYRQKQGKPTKASRLMLHAARLSFTDLTGQKHDYTCPPEGEFLSILYDLLPASQTLDNSRLLG